MLSDNIFYTPVSGEIRQAMIMFHGYGSNGDDLISLAADLANYIPDTIFYAPNAPDVLTANGYKWYDIDERASVSAYEYFDYIQKLMNNAKSALLGVMDFMRYIEYKHSIRQEDVILMGFSQGGLLAVMSGISSSPTVKGIIASSTIPMTINQSFTPVDIKSTPPVLLTHGLMDDVVPFKSMEMTENTLENIGCKTITHTVDGMGHAIDDSCKKEMVNFILNL